VIRISGETGPRYPAEHMIAHDRITHTLYTDLRGWQGDLARRFAAALLGHEDRIERESESGSQRGDAGRAREARNRADEPLLASHLTS
jgi:hypothetical protein